MIDWNHILAEEFKQPYMVSLREFVERETLMGRHVFPPTNDLFKAFELTPFNDVKVVILGQDPYIKPGQAHGLAFSVQEGIQVPPSLQNIYKEIGIPQCKNGCLTSWAKQGVLLLNNVLTVEEGKPKSHYNRGWEQFTDKVIDHLNEQKTYVVFMLWGSEAQKKGARINKERHLVLTAPHPSPLSSHKGFLGCKHFNVANLFLLQVGKTPINWESVLHV